MRLLRKVLRKLLHEVTRFVKTGVGAPDARAREPVSTSDIYSPACMVYEMLVGQPPFTGCSAKAVMARHVSEQPSKLRAFGGSYRNTWRMPCQRRCPRKSVTGPRAQRS